MRNRFLIHFTRDPDQHYTGRTDAEHFKAFNEEELKDKPKTFLYYSYSLNAYCKQQYGEFHFMEISAHNHH